jgi:predicted nucleotidyltransferase
VTDRRPPAELRADEILRRLTARGVDFVVVGGIAAVLHGSSSATFDLDITYAVDPGNLAALGEVLKELDVHLRGVDDELPFAPDGEALRRIELLTLVTRFGELDLLANPVGSSGYQELRRRAERFDIGGFSVLVASIDDLIVMKLAAGRVKDLAAVEELEAIRELRAGLD